MSARKPRVLVVDDREEITDMVKLFLGERGYDVACCGDGKTGLTAIRAGGFDVLVADVLLPEELGTELGNEAQKHGLGVVLISGSPSAEKMAADLPFEFLRKPFRLYDLLGAVEAADQQRQSVNIEPEPTRYAAED